MRSDVGCGAGGHLLATLHNDVIEKLLGIKRRRKANSSKLRVQNVLRAERLFVVLRDIEIFL